MFSAAWQTTPMAVHTAEAKYQVMAKNRVESKHAREPRFRAGPRPPLDKQVEWGFTSTVGT